MRSISKGAPPTSAFRRGVVTMLKGSVAQQAISFFGAFWVAGVYAPEQVGIMGAFTAAMLMLGAIASSTMEQAIPLPESDEDAAHVFALSLLLTGASTLILAIIAYFWAAPLARMANVPQIAPFAWMLIVGFIGLGIYQSLNYAAIRLRLYPLIARARFTQTLIGILAQVGFGYAFAAPTWGIVFGWTLGRFGGVPGQSLAVWKAFGGHLRNLKRERLWANLVRYRKFPLVQSWSVTLTAAGLQLPPLLVASFYDTKVAGFFFLTQRALGMPSQIAGTAVGQVFVGEAAQLAQTNPQEMLRRFYRITRKMFLIGIGPTLLLMAVGLPLDWVMGAKWQGISPYFQVLAISYFLRFAGESIVNLQMIEANGLSLAWSILRVIMVFGVFVAGKQFAWPALTTITAYSVALSVSYALKWFAFVWAAKRLKPREVVVEPA